MPSKFFKILSASFVLGFSTVHGATFTFSGGNGAPLQLTLLESISYTVIAEESSQVVGPSFVVKGVGDPFSPWIPAVTGTIAFTINGGVPIAITWVGSGVAANDADITDMFMYGSLPLPDVAAGDILTLTAGTLTTIDPVSKLAPANGSFTTFISDLDANRISNDGISLGSPVSVPEGGNSVVLLGLSAAALLALRRRMRA